MDESKKNKILVTGGCGFIGSHTVVSLIEKGFEPIIVDSLENSEKFILENLQTLTKTRIKFYHENCCDELAMKKIFAEENLSGVIHFAAYKAVGESVAQPLKYYKNNIGSLITLLELCEKYKVSNFIFSSSCTVYGNPDNIPVNESTPIRKAESPYGETKIICENIINQFSSVNSWFKPVILRYFNPIGSHPSGLIGELPIGVPNNLVPFITQTAKGIRKELTVFGNDYSTTDGTCVRDYIHVCDLADAHVVSLSKIDHIKSFPVYYNLGTGKGNSVLEVIQIFEKISSSKLNYIIGKRRSGDVESIYANTSKAQNELGWKCKFSLEDALNHAWNWENSYANFKSTNE